MTKLKIRESLINYVKNSYVSDEDGAHGAPEFDCALGINPFGCSEQVKKALSETEDPSHYPDYPYTQTLKALSSFWSKTSPVKPSNFRMYGGSVAALDAVCRIFGQGISLGYTPQFTEFITVVTINGGLYESVNMAENPNCKFDEKQLIAAIDRRHSLVYIDNPNNPTGQVISLDQIEKIIKKAGEAGAAVLVDEAYADYIEDSESAITLINNYDNLFVARSFSKGYGLAGLRVGYLACCDDLQSYLRKTGLPFAISSRNAKLAVTALGDQDFIKFTRSEVLKIKPKMLSGLKKLKVLETDKRTPIMSLEDTSGENLFEKLLRKGVLTEFGPEVGLGVNAVRLRIHRQDEKLTEILNSL